MKTKFYLFILFFFLGSVAKADLYLEPYLGYHQSNNSLSVTNLNLDGKFSGLGYGLRVGGTYYQFQFGLDYSLTPGSWDGDSITTSAKIKATHLGLFAGWRLFSGWKFLFTYFLTSKLSYDIDGSGFFFIDDDATPTNRANSRTGSFHGDGFRLSAGYAFLPSVALSLEYQLMSYDRFGSVDLSQSGLDLYKTDGIFITVSFPFDLIGTSSFSSGYSSEPAY